ncbi:MAG: flippase [Candidatus Kerfeldbacteria bacterium]|nr:flippase [Candidatus Kerfeldbacteria bacterium]
MIPRPSSANGGSIAKNTTYLTGALIGQKILSFLYVLILARLVGVRVTGDYFSALSFITLFSIFIDLGLTPAFIRQTARDRQQGLTDLHHIVTFKLLSSAVVIAALFGSIALLDSMGRSHPDSLFIRWAAVIMVLDSMTLTLYGYFRGIQRLEFESIGTILHRVVVMIIGITGLVLGAHPVITVMAVLGGSASNFLYVVFHLWRQGVVWRPRLQWRVLRSLLRLALPFGVAGLFTAVYASSDNVLLSIFGGNREVGLYGLAAKIILAFQILPAALVAATFPAMSAAFITDRARLERIFRYSMQYLMVITVPLMVIVSLLAKQIIILGWGAFWLDAVWPLRFLALALPFLFLNYPVGYLLNAANAQTRNTINIGITVVVNVALNLVFIEQYTYRSVTIIALGSAALLFSLGLWYVRRIITVPAQALLTTLGKTLLAGLIVALFGWWLIPQLDGRTGAITAAILMGLLYLVLAFVLRLMRTSDAQALLQRLRRT